MLRKSTQELSSIRIRVALKADSPILPFVREALSQAKLDLSLSHAACRVSILFENVNLISFLKRRKKNQGLLQLAPSQLNACKILHRSKSCQVPKNRTRYNTLL